MTFQMEGVNTPIIIGCDHAAIELKDVIVKYLMENNVDVKDVGTHGPESVNYADFGRQVASAVSSGQYDRGILLCGTGLGMSIVANRYPRVRAALCGDTFSARMSRLHNDSNILVLGARVIGTALAIDLVKTWLETPFEGGRHLERLKTFDTI